MFSRDMNIADFDPDLWSAMQSEDARQEHHIELIASENYTSPRVMEVQGSQLTNKYAEGYPGKRYYGGCEHVDVIEQLAIDRAKELFGAGYANVQPHSGAQANMAVYFAFLQPGDTVLGMRLDQGGHLSHGSPVSFSGQLYNFVPYGVSPEDERIDYRELERLAGEHRPKIIMAGASSYPRAIDFQRFRAVADAVEAPHPVLPGRHLGQDLHGAAGPGRRRRGDRLGGQHRLHDQPRPSARDDPAQGHRGTWRITRICARSRLTTRSAAPAADCPPRSTTPWTARADRSRCSSGQVKAVTPRCAYRCWTPSGSRVWARAGPAPGPTRSRRS